MCMALALLKATRRPGVVTAAGTDIIALRESLRALEGNVLWRRSDRALAGVGGAFNTRQEGNVFLE